MTIYEKISEIMKSVERLSKDDTVSYKSTNYKALSEEKVTSIMREKLIEQSLIVYPIYQTATRTENITHVDVTYRMVNCENPEEYIDIASCGDGADTQDKGSGKAMTYAFKYMWLRTFAIPTGEDPDKISSAELDKNDESEKKLKTEICSKVKTLAKIRGVSEEEVIEQLNKKANTDKQKVELLTKWLIKSNES